MSVTLTEDMVMARRVVSGFAGVVQPPVDVRQGLFEILRECTPAEVSAEHLGWVLTAVSRGLLHMVQLAIAEGADPNNVVAPRMLGVLCSTAEAFLVEAELPSLDEL